MCDPCGGVLFTLDSDADCASPVFFVGSQGGFCYFSDSLEQCIQLIISLPLTLWTETVYPFSTVEEFKEELALVEDEVKEEIESANADDRKNMINARKNLSEKLAIELLDNPLDIIIDNRRKVDKFKLIDYEGYDMRSWNDVFEY